MKLTSKTDYCLSVLIFLQKNQSRVKIQQIADEYHISKNHLNVVVNTLSRLGYIISTPGPHGGIEFNKKFADHSVGDLVGEIEDFNIVDCFDVNEATCVLKDNCKLKRMIKKASLAFVQELKQYKIKELV